MQIFGTPGSPWRILGDLRGGSPRRNANLRENLPREPLHAVSLPGSVQISVVACRFSSMIGRRLEPVYIGVMSQRFTPLDYLGPPIFYFENLTLLFIA
jgi:hypothetical protein